MFIPLEELTKRFGGELKGAPGIQVSGVAPLDKADTSHISFLTNSRLHHQAAQSKAAAIIVSPADDAILAKKYKGARIVADNPYAYFARTAQLFETIRRPPRQTGIHQTACVDPAAKIAASAKVGPHVTIEAGAEIGENCIIDAGCFIGEYAKVGANSRFFANVVFHARCEIGENGVLHSGAVIGSDGFGFANDKGTWIKIPQTGRVIIGNDVQIGSNSSVDRGTLDDTIIEDNVKIDNQIQIGHNCHIGAHTAMAGCVGVAGSTKIGKYCTLGGAAMIGGHLTIVDHVHISAATPVASSIDKPGLYTGMYPIAKHTEWEKTAVITRNLAAMREKIRKLEKTINTLTGTKT